MLGILHCLVDCLLWWRQLLGWIAAPRWGPYAWAWEAAVRGLMINTTWMNLNMGPPKVALWDDYSLSKHWLQLKGDSEPDPPTKLFSDPNLQKFCNHKYLLFQALWMPITNSAIPVLSTRLPIWHQKFSAMLAIALVGPSPRTLIGVTSDFPVLLNVLNATTI